MGIMEKLRFSEETIFSFLKIIGKDNTKVIFFALVSNKIALIHFIKEEYPMPMTEPTQAVLQNLPNELFVNHIATTLDARSIAALSKTCRRFRALFKAERLYLREAHYFCPNDTSAYEFSEKIKKSIQAIKR